MSWKVRHEGSPQSSAGLTLPQVIDGLRDGQWEPTDEVMGPGEHSWTAIENHPQLADAAADFEPLPPRTEADETRLDMNPLIDVSLVLLIFFILTTSYAALQRVLAMPGTTQKKEGPRVVTRELVQQYTIQVQIRRENGKPVIRVENEVVEEKNLPAALSRFVSATRKTELLLDVAEGIDWGTVVTIRDAAMGTGIQRVIFLVKPEAAPAKNPKGGKF